ncbi:tRNA pseudouridine(55) synthase TruB [Candidatus Falkowbacteria bacterium]|jgi:tRNA pseudouridine55 synthase|nr:tRNA pseudouridine(55) synthase TruB [Candidatus Falkowbacteria bacterium]MBT5503522.1 tRNA pseudouridine(55) synthase TruB [Candidatus Falkowbacteria bacterium]MBT6574411.1 tRNA pseudouridine(55) synthase TruB [Candidatus Falkowbacteria bacterium]MBT7348928.1 tRNA pseudouridine(55) synthase TruB [Candidatus Falkowbacteria bacterium]MBT7501284.1 tRNA pseudouridine(55) synthase TruB [Candidatus Falkowbacteria bacterium]
MLEGIIVVDKPKGPTSHDIVDQVRRITGIRKVGHAGTLDPLASGVLVVAIGRENTKKIDEIVKTEKEYIAKIKLGETSTTDDAEGDKTQISNTKYQIPNDALLENLKQFEGEVLQIPPAFSAIKMKGKKAYELARKGQEVKMASRKIFIKEIELIKYEWPYLEIKVTCGPGTYIRSLARDIGEKLKIGAYLAELQRTRVGDYTIEQAVDLK